MMFKKIILLSLMGALTASCGLPRSGPTKGQLLAGDINKSGNAFVIPVTDAVARITREPSQLGFSSSFLNASLTSTETFSVGDVVQITVWENIDNGVLAELGRKVTDLRQMQIDEAGYIFVPYAGRIRVVGRSPEELRRIITNSLAAQTPDPQVEVRRSVGEDGGAGGKGITITGGAGAQGVYPLTQSARTLQSVLAKAGGSAVPAEVAQVRVTRAGRTESIWLQDLYDNPQLDIALRPGDVITIEQDDRQFIALGAISQATVPFEKRDMNIIEALATIGGLNTQTSDPTGVFILRKENQNTVQSLVGRSDFSGDQRVIYVLNMLEPNALFMATEFLVRDDDIIYVTEAPYVYWTKLIASAVGLGNNIQGLQTTAGIFN